MEHRRRIYYDAVLLAKKIEKLWRFWEKTERHGPSAIRKILIISIYAIGQTHAMNLRIETTGKPTAE
jgi:hypothetical protein